MTQYGYVFDSDKTNRKIVGRKENLGGRDGISKNYRLTMTTTGARGRDTGRRGVVVGGRGE